MDSRSLQPKKMKNDSTHFPLFRATPPFSSSSSLIFPRFIFYFTFTKAPIARVRFFLASDSYPIDPSCAALAGPTSLSLSPPSTSFFRTACCSFQAGCLTLYAYIALPRHASLHPRFVSLLLSLLLHISSIRYPSLCSLARLSSNKNKISSYEENIYAYIYIYSPREKSSFLPSNLRDEERKGRFCHKMEEIMEEAGVYNDNKLQGRISPKLPQIELSFPPSSNNRPQFLPFLWIWYSIESAADPSNRVDIADIREDPLLPHAKRRNRKKESSSLG